MQLNERLQQFREKAGYENAKLFAKAIGMPYSTYSTYESGKSEPKATALIRIASALHVSVDDLLGYHISDFDKAAALFHESVGGQATLNGETVTFSNMPTAKQWNKPISKSAFISVINDCVKDFNKKARPQLLKYMIINKINGIYFKNAMMTIANALFSEKEQIEYFRKSLDKTENEALTKILTDKSYREKFLSSLPFDTCPITTPQNHDDTNAEHTTKKGPHPKE